MQAELRRIQAEGRKKLVMEWAGRLQTPGPGSYRGSGERGSSRNSIEDLSMGELGSELCIIIMYLHIIKTQVFAGGF